MMSKSDELLVGIVNKISDYELLQNQGWYRIPIQKADKLLRKRWPPKWIAFYYTNAIKDFPQMIIHYAKISKITTSNRRELFPLEKENYKSKLRYYKISFHKFETLPKPILSRRWRRIVFIQTTYKKFINAVEVNDLYDGSRLEDRLWAEFKRNGIGAERQQVIRVDDKFYFLDFAIHCKKGKINVETDGDRWHHNPQGSTKDNLRNNDLASNGWCIIRFDSNQIREKMETYCIPTVKVSINKLGGMDLDTTTISRFLKYNPNTFFKIYFEEYE